MLKFIGILFRRRVLIPAGAAVVLIVIAYAYTQGNLIRKMDNVYRYPQTTKSSRQVKIEGPTMTWQRSEKRADVEIVERIEYRDAVFHVTEDSSSSAPVPVSVAMAGHRTDRWLLGLSVLDFAPREGENWRIQGGYSFRNRADVLLGLGYDGGIRSQLTLVWRF